MKRARRRRQVHLRFKGKRNRRWHRAWGRKAARAFMAEVAADIAKVMDAFFVNATPWEPGVARYVGE